MAEFNAELHKLLRRTLNCATATPPKVTFRDWFTRKFSQ